MNCNYVESIPKTNIDLSMISLNELSILYIDNDNIPTKKVETFLVEIFKKVETTSSGKNALSKFVEYDTRNFSFDLVLIDEQVSDIKIADFIKRLKSLSVNIPCVVIADHNSDFICKANKLDVSDYLVKPLRIYNLIYILKKAYLTHISLYHEDNLAVKTKVPSRGADKIITENVNNDEWESF